MSDQYNFHNWESRRGQGWGDATQGDSPWDNLDFHVDLGCGTIKKGRIGVDRYAAPGVDHRAAVPVDLGGLGSRSLSLLHGAVVRVVLRKRQRRLVA
jgi:hypothetical protein